jgi:site-specific DNA-cytosine methylase
MKEENWTEQTVKNALRAGASKSSHVIVEALPFDTTLAAQGHPPTVIAKTYDARGNGDGETVNTLTGDHNNRITDYTSVIVENAPTYCHSVAYAMQAFGAYKESEVASSLKRRDYKDATDLVAFVDTTHADDVVRVDNLVSPLQARDHKGGKLIVEEVAAHGADCRNLTEHPELYPTLQAKPGGGHSLNFSGACRIQYIIRRLTPLECCRLQGFPDWWEDGVEGSDSARYKMWGNGMALPNMLFVMQRIAKREVHNDHQQEKV